MGSLLGDGYISKGANRSKNYYYQEHFGESQREYRKWKLNILRDLTLKLMEITYVPLATLISLRSILLSIRKAEKFWILSF
ncbi:hypothetical protein [Oceanobacillus kapialis]|uniref:hypothetical protein n=1 Tax=Oceanobacillus kapialis TaxID=481353 RepID=UPI00384E1025